MKRGRFALLIVLMMLLLPMSVMAEEMDEEDITQYYNENVPSLNSWKDEPQTYFIGDKDDSATNHYASITNLLHARLLMPGDTMKGVVSGENVWYLMLRGNGEESLIGITDRYGTGSDANTYSFGNETKTHLCYREIVLDKLENEVLDIYGSSEAGGTNESPKKPIYHRCFSTVVKAYPSTLAITYDYDDGKVQYGTNSTQVNVSNKERDLYMYSPVKEGYHFTGWYGGGCKNNEDGTWRYTISACKTGSFQFEATYSRGNTVKLVAGENATIHCLPELIVEMKESFRLEDYVPQKEGYRFIGWYDNPDFLDASVMEVTKFTDYNKAVLYAKFVLDKSGFIERMYQHTLNRASDQAGRDYWLDGMNKGKLTGADLAAAFILSPELVGKNLSNEEYIKMMYHAFFDREPDPEGFAFWLGKFEKGLSRKYVLSEFVQVKEYNDLCGECGIDGGSYVSDEPRDVNESLTAYLSRCYTKALGRGFDADGMNYWAFGILSGEMNAKDTAITFVLSQEFTDRNLSEEEYISVLYDTFFGRQSDSEGFAYWSEKLSSGSMSRYDLLLFFANSEEFAAIMKSFGV